MHAQAEVGLQQLSTLSHPIAIAKQILIYSAMMPSKRSMKF
jgi:hypothetical protein